MSNTPPVNGVTFIVDPNRRFTIWNISDIYKPGGDPEVAKYVPNKNDEVRDWESGTYRVTDVDYTTGISILTKWKEPTTPGEVEDVDVLLAAGPGHVSESYRCYIDDSVIPHTLCVDARAHLHGTTLTSFKVFLGSDIGQNGEVISSLYDNAGNLLGENIPFELVAMDDINNFAIKAPMVGHTNRKLKDGEQLTLVAYDASGQPRSQALLVVKNTRFIRRHDASLKYVLGISLETPFLNPSDPNVVEYPINMPVAGLNLMGRVTYSDGTSLSMPVDGTKFSIAGLTNYVATIQGQPAPLMLYYQLSDGEVAYLDTPAPNRKVPKPYTARTKERDGAYSVKLYVVPTWVDLLTGYRLNYFLYDLDRKTVYDVTSHVEFGVNSPAFRPTEYGVVQNLVVRLNMQKVNPQFEEWAHTQTFALTLLRRGDQDVGTNWTIGYDPGQNPPYGEALKAAYKFINVGNYQLNVSCGALTQDEWLERLYYRSKPLFDARSESAPLVPTHFTVVTGTQSIDLPISAWNQTITATAIPAEGRPVYIRFIRRMADNDLQLALAGLITHQTP